MRRFFTTLLSALRRGSPSAPRIAPGRAIQNTSPQFSLASEASESERTPHCRGDGSFSVAAVGESFYRAKIAAIAKNPAGSSALVYCTAMLFLDDGNEFDSRAVAILIEGEKVGHLCREDAVSFREGLAQCGYANKRTTCDAVLRGGYEHEQRHYDYSVELDLQLDRPVQADGAAQPTYPVPTRCASEVSIVSDMPDEIVIRFPHLSRHLIGLCQDCADVATWLSPDGHDLHFSAGNTAGGTGRLGVLSTRKLAGLAARIEDMAHVTALRVDGQALYVRAAGTHDPRLEFLVGDSFSTIVVDHASADGITTAVFMMSFTSKTSTGALLAQRQGLGWEISETDETVLQNMVDLFSKADLIVSRRSKSEVASLQALLGEVVSQKALWRSTFNVWGNQFPQHPPGTLRVDLGDPSNAVAPGKCESSCRELASFLFHHTGKTSRSKTMLGRLMP